MARETLVVSVSQAIIWPEPTPAEYELNCLLHKHGKILLIFNAGAKERRMYRGATEGGKANRSNICYREMESISRLLKTVKENVKSLAKVEARKKRCSAKLLAPCCYGRYRNQENWPP